MIERRKIAIELPYRLALRVLADILVVVGLVGMGVFTVAVAQGSIPPPTAADFPWNTLILDVAVAVLGLFVWLVKNQVSRVHVSINSKMDRLLELTAQAARAEGVLEGKASVKGGQQ